MVEHIFSQDKPVGDLDLVMAFDGPMPTGVSVSHSGRIFVNFPRWDDPVDFTVSLATDGYLYFTVNQLHRGPRFHRGKDLRERPFGLFRVRVDASPVLLR
jgi:hypothetical protein